MHNHAHVLEGSARECPDKTAIVFNDFRLSFKQVNEMANQVANALTQMGIGHGDKVALTCPNLPYFPMIWYGVLKTGAVLVPLSVLLRGREIEYHLKDSESVAYFCFEGTPEMPMAKAGWEGFQKAGTCKHFISIPAVPGGPSPIPGTKTLFELFMPQPTVYDTKHISPHDSALIIYTSGTTGLPKGAELSHSNLTMNRVVTSMLFGAKQDDITMVVLPLFHSFGISVLDVAMLMGGTAVLIPRFDTDAVVKAFEKESISLFAGVPTMYWELLNHSGAGVDFQKIKDRMRMGISGGAALPVEVLRGFEQKYEVPILEGYGLSETSPTATFNREDRPRKVGSIGLPIWGVEVKVVDGDMNEVAVGQPGEIVIRGHNVMKGYYKRPEANEEAFRGGWFHSGDIGTKDEDGYLYIVDRMKDMIIRGGFNVYPRELEEVLLTHPDVSLAAVIGVPSDQHGEEVKAYVVPKIGKNPKPEEIIKWSKEQMAAYKYPRFVEVVDALPLGPTGKILKLELRKMDEQARAAVK